MERGGEMERAWWIPDRRRPHSTSRCVRRQARGVLPEGWTSVCYAENSVFGCKAREVLIRWRCLSRLVEESDLCRRGFPARRQAG